MSVSATPPAPTPEYDALAPRGTEAPMDALARVGDDILKEFGGGDERKDASRKNKKMPKQLAALVGLRAQGFDNAEIAQRLGVTPRKLTALIAKARKEYGWSDLAEKIAHVAVPRAVDNVIRHLEHEGSDIAALNGQNLMTRTVLAGTGVFKTHSAVKQTSKTESLNVLRIEIAGLGGSELSGGSTGAGSIEGVLATPRRAVSSGENAPALPPAASVIDVEVVR